MVHLNRVKLGLAVAAVAVMLGFGATQAHAQSTGTVRGTITDAQTHRPLAGVQVSVGGAGRRAVTSTAGEYTVANVPTGNTTVRAELLGYAAAERNTSVAAGQTVTVNLEMGTSAVALDALVVTGTPGGTQRRAIGTSVAQVQVANVVETAPVRSVQDLVNGRAPGVVIIPGTGTVGSGARIRIRGVSSLSLSQEPLIYVDGVRVNNAQSTGPINQAFGSSTISRWNDFNPEDIESIEIIKGPAAATLYGTEAANGVMQIITKRGAQGRPHFNATVRQGANWFGNAAGRLYTNYGINPQTKQIETIDYATLERLNGKIFQTGHLQEYELNVSGGSSGVRYFVGGGWNRNEGIEPNNVDRKFNGRANVSITPNNSIDINASAGYVHGRIGLPLESGGGGTTWTTYFATPANLGTAKNGFYSATPAGYYYAYQDWQDLDRFTGGLQITHRPFGWLSHRLAIGTDVTGEGNGEMVQRISDPYYQQFFSAGEIRGYKDLVSRTVYYNTFDYSASAQTRPFASVSSQTSVGAQYYRRFSKFVEGYGEDFPARGLTAIEAATGRRTAIENYDENSTVGVFFQEQVGLRDDRLFLTAAVRMDDNSAFGSEFDLVRYPKASMTWVVSEEPFWGVPAFSTLKLRAAYGESGQQPINFAALRTFAPVTGTNDQAAVTPQSLGNPNLGPERSGELELGFDAGFLDDRAGLEFTYYSKRTRDAILRRDIAPSTGFSGTQYINAGEIRNSGFEVLARGTPISRRSTTLDLNFSLATNHNRIETLGIPGLTFVSAGTFLQHREGYPVGSWFEKRIVDAKFDAAGKLIAGSEMCDDGAGGVIACAKAPTVFLGRPTPRLEGAFTPTLTVFKNLRLSGMVDFKQGFYKLNGDMRVRCVLFGRCRENFYPAEFVNDPAWLAQTQRGGAFVNGLIQDASFTKLRELSASYTLPASLAGRFGASRASVTVAGRNLYTWTKYPGLEPEASFLGGSTRGSGSAQWEQNVTPQLQQFVTTVNVSF